MFGQSDADWMDADFLIAEPDEELGRNMYWLFWDNADEGATRSIEDAFEYVDTDANGKQKFNVSAWRHAVSKTAIPIELAGSISAGILAQEEGAELSEQIVWFASPNAPNEYVVASMKVLTASFVVTENNVTETVTNVQRVIHPITYVYGDESKGITAEEVAKTHAELFTMTGTFKDAFTNIDAGQPDQPLAQSDDANTNGASHETPESCGLQYRIDVRNAYADAQIEILQCGRDDLGVLGTAGAFVGAVCCAGGGILGGSATLGIGAPAGCLAGIVICGPTAGGLAIKAMIACRDQARTDQMRDLLNARDRRDMCCIRAGNCNLSPDGG